MGNELSKGPKPPSRSSKSPPNSRSPIRKSSSPGHIGPVGRPSRSTQPRTQQPQRRASQQSPREPNYRQRDALVATIESQWATLTDVFGGRVCPPVDPRSWPSDFLIALEHFSQLVPVGSVGNFLGPALRERHDSGTTRPLHLTLVDVYRAQEPFRARRTIASIDIVWGRGRITEILLPEQIRQQGSPDRWNTELLEGLAQLSGHVVDGDEFCEILDTVQRNLGYDFGETPLLHGSSKRLNPS